MLIATNNKNDQLLAAKNLWKLDHYFCPSCQSPVHLKAGSVMRAHFAHFQKEACDVFSEGETEEHLRGKQQLYDWLVSLGHEVEMEAYLPQLMQRPDLLLKLDKEKIAIEFQCSAIAIEKVRERTAGYLNNGYKVIWVLGEQFTYQRKLTAFQKVCLTNSHNQLVLFHYSVSKKQLEYRYNFQLKQNQKMIATKRQLKARSPLKLDLKKKAYLSNEVVKVEMEHQKLQRQLQYPKNNSREFMTKLYENNETLISMPKECYEILPSEWLIQNHHYAWKLKFIVWLESRQPNTVLTHKMLHRWADGLNYFEVPPITDKQRLQPILEFVYVLVQSNVLKQIRFNKWVIVQTAKRYKYLEEKFQ